MMLYSELGYKDGALSEVPQAELPAAYPHRTPKIRRTGTLSRLVS